MVRAFAADRIRSLINHQYLLSRDVWKQMEHQCFNTPFCIQTWFFLVSTNPYLTVDCKMLNFSQPSISPHFAILFLCSVLLKLKLKTLYSKTLSLFLPYPCIYVQYMSIWSCNVLSLHQLYEILQWCEILQLCLHCYHILFWSKWADQS